MLAVQLSMSRGTISTDIHELVGDVSPNVYPAGGRSDSDSHRIFTKGVIVLPAQAIMIVMNCHALTL